MALVKLRETVALSHENLFGLAATIEVERHRRTNPGVPDWLAAEYHDAWNALLLYALNELRASDEPDLLQSAAAVACLAKGLISVGAVLWYQDRDTLAEYLEERLSWTDLYVNKAR